MTTSRTVTITFAGDDEDEDDPRVVEALDAAAFAIDDALQVVANSGHPVMWTWG